MEDLLEEHVVLLLVKLEVQHGRGNLDCHHDRDDRDDHHDNIDGLYMKRRQHLSGGKRFFLHCLKEGGLMANKWVFTPLLSV